MKAYLIEKNIPLIKTHDLIKLNGMINEVENIGIDEKKLFAINEIYIETRYPGELGLGPGGMPASDEAKGFLEYAKEIKTIIYRSLRIFREKPESE
jgi:HEPN domain-containing protein